MSNGKITRRLKKALFYTDKFSAYDEAPWMQQRLSWKGSGKNKLY
nr:hypothetical protein [Candidatus Protochlamydia amoebophila]